MMAIRRKLLFLAALFATFILGRRGATSSEQRVITLEPGTTYQTVTGWEATAQAGHAEFRTLFPKYKDTLYDLAVDE